MTDLNLPKEEFYLQTVRWAMEKGGADKIQAEYFAQKLTDKYYENEEILKEWREFFK